MAAITRRPVTTFSYITALLICFLSCTASMGYCATERNVVATSRKLVAAIPTDLPPTYFLDKNGKPAGFAVDVMNELARRSDLTVEYVSGQAFDDIIQMVVSGKADLIPSLTIDEQRKELLAFTDTVGFLPANLFVASGNLTVQGISPGLNIGVLKGSAPETLLKKNQTINVETFANIQAMLFELLAGHVDGIVFLTPNLMKLAIDAGVDDKIKVVGKPIIEARRGIALRKGDTELLTILNKAIAEFIGSPEYQQIYIKWYGSPKPFWTANKIGAASAVFLVLIVFGMAFWRYRSVVHLNTSLTLNISERKRAEDALRESEARFRAIFMQAAVGVGEIEIETGRFLTVNRSLCEMVGRTEEEMLATTFHEITHPEDLHLHEKETALMLAGKIRRYEIEKRYIKKDGSSIWVNLTSSPLWKQEETPTRNLIVVQDITDRKRAVKALIESERHMKLVTDNVPALIGYVDKNYQYRFVNKNYEKWFGLKQKDALGVSVDKLLPRRTYEHSLPFINRALAGEEVTFESTAPLPDGSTKHFYNHLVPDRSPSGEINGYYVLVSDITESKRAENEKRSLEERLQRAEKMEALGTLAGGVAHDLNNVLGVLSGYSELLLDEIPKENPSRSHVEKILKSTKKGAAIIEDLLTLARRGVTEMAVITLDSVVSGFMTTPAFENIKDNNLRVVFHTECDGNLLKIKGSPVHLEKVLMNLVANAAEAINNDGVVTIKTEGRYLEKPISGYDEIKEGEYAVLIVSDTGIGIAAENRGKIFEPFFTKKKMGRSGTGLGLSIVWGTVKDHKGYIDLRTEVGKGTSFTLYFPVTREELTAPKADVPIEQYMGRGESVLVVDDLADQREIASSLLAKLGYDVHLVSSGEAAVEYLKTQKVEIIVLDMLMPPGMDGLDTYKRILETNPRQKAIIVSGFSETDRTDKARKLGAGSYVKKPYELEKIGVAIREVLKR